MHARGIRHGDLKTENVMVTTWNWALLTDLAFYKPTYLPAGEERMHTAAMSRGERMRVLVRVR